MMLNQDQLATALGQELYGADGAKLGKIEQIFVDSTTGAASWFTVQTGLFGNKETFIPAHQAGESERGLSVPYSKDDVKQAPSVSPDDGQLSQDDSAALLQHYGVEPAPSAPWPTQPQEDDQPHEDDHAVEGQDVSPAMTLSEEQLQVGTETVESGRARISKHVVTEEQTVTVPVSHEEVRLEREPITDGNRGDGSQAAELGEEEHEITLTEERIVVTRETVPVERVQLVKETVTQDEQVSEPVRREEVETDPATLNRATDAGDDRV